MSFPGRPRKPADYPPLSLGRGEEGREDERGAEELLLRCYPNNRPLYCRRQTPLCCDESGRRRRRSKYGLPPSPPSPPSCPTLSASCPTSSSLLSPSSPSFITIRRDVLWVPDT